MATDYVPVLVGPDPSNMGTGSILQGSGVPSNSIGVNGEVYVNIANGDIYTKSGDVWTIIASGTGAGPESGNGSPEGVLARPVGTLYTDTNDHDNPRLFSKITGGSGNTGWVQLI